MSSIVVVVVVIFWSRKYLTHYDLKTLLDLNNTTQQYDDFRNEWQIDLLK